MSVKGFWSRVKDYEAYGANMDRIYGNKPKEVIQPEKITRYRYKCPDCNVVIMLHVKPVSGESWKCQVCRKAFTVEYGE